MLYFAYGSNLLLERMYGRCPGTQLLGRATLKDYVLCFQNNNTGKVVANVIERKGRKVKGVLYHVTQRDIDSLDRAEGYPYVYKRRTLKVEFNGREVECVTYQMEQKYKAWDVIKVGKKFVQCYEEYEREFGYPDAEYLGMVVQGYTEQGLGMEGDIMKLLAGKEYKSIGA